jgi:hypothetical protein
MKNWKTTLLGLLAVAVQAVLQAIASGQIDFSQLAPTAVLALGLFKAKDVEEKE